MANVEGKKEVRGVKDPGELLERIAQDRGVDVFLCLLENPATPGELTNRLGISRAKINYLLDCFLQEDLVYLHSEKRNGSNIEKYYAVKADTFHLQFGEQGNETQQVKTLLYILDVMKENMMQAIRTREVMQLGMVHVKIKKDRLQEYLVKVKELQQEFDREIAEHDNEDSAWYTMVLSVFPGPQLQ